ncbi:TetR/AcrR family transcriptional regulator [Sphingomonas sp.]|uniref:TetR/AcrR family transcriptional regulator n=1 Tax=Sphingomonas sp. TaxID=28214 RepID=UPI0026299FF4|nr:TetR/AcrR family transcriptional regulator [Sphingomonas sp.]MDF2496296.1 hypothetical protein [Sphingomonas sp.]
MSIAAAAQAPAPRGSGKGHKFDARRQEILAASGALLNRHGLRGATLSMVASEIDLNLKSLRYYYKRKEDLVAAAFLHSIDLHQQLIDASEAEPTPEARLRTFIDGYFALQARVRKGEQPEFVHFGDVRALTEPQASIVFTAYIDMFRRMRGLIHQPGDGWDKQVLNARTHALLSQLLWSVVWLRYYLPEDFPRVANRFGNLLLHGIAPGRPMPEVVGIDLQDDVADGERLSRDSFLRAATELINAHGYRGASVERISAALNVTKGSFYHHNDTKEDLVVACFQRTFDVMRRGQNEALRRHDKGFAQLTEAMVNLVQFQLRPTGTLLRTSALTAIDVHLRDEMNFRMNQLTARFEDMLIDGIADGSGIACDARIAAQMVTGLINSTEELPRWAAGVSANTVVDLYVRPMFSGLLSRSA